MEIPLGVERVFWGAVYNIRHPVIFASAWWHRLQRPKPGERVECCDYKVREVASVDDDGDTLTMTDGGHYSWMHCCGRVSKKWLRTIHTG